MLPQVRHVRIEAGAHRTRMWVQTVRLLLRFRAFALGRGGSLLNRRRVDGALRLCLDPGRGSAR